MNAMIKILVVDDEKSVQRLYLQRFRKETRSGDVELHFAFSGEEALQFLNEGEAHDVTLVLSDINMPKMSGLEVLKIVRTRYPALKVLIITAYVDDQNRDEAISLGADDYLAKPIDFKVLKEKIFDMV